MKKYLALCLIMITVMSLISCSGSPKPSESPSASASSAPTTGQPSPSENASPSASPSPVESATALFLTGEPTAPEVSKYLSYNASHFSREDGDLLLERLLLLQLDVSAVMNIRIWDTPYMTALNDTLGGILDAGKIPDITDKTVRGDFQNVADSMMTMVRYEETPVFEPDWAALKAMKDAFSAQAGVMIEYQSRLQGRYYFGDPFAFDLMAADIVAVEQALKQTDIGFVRWQLEHVYNVQVERLLLGPEGSYLNMFMAGDKQVVSNIKKYADQYADSAFGAICKGVLAKQTDGDQAVSNFITDSLLFAPGDQGAKLSVSIDYNGAKIQAPQLIGIADPAVTEKVNTSILAAAKALVTSGNNNQTVSSYISFINGKYISVTFSYSYRNGTDMDHYSEAYLMLDLKTGESVSLDTLFGKPFGSYKDQLLQLIHGKNAPKDLKEPVSFSISRNEMMISVPSATSDWPDNFSISWNGLRSLMDISKLY